MARIKSLTVTVRMGNGELRAGLELRSVTEQDEHDLVDLIETAKQRGLYDVETKVLEFNGLGGDNLYWPGLGVENRLAFEKIPRGNWGNCIWRVLFMSNPCHYVAEPDDLSETCLCQNDYSCQICRLQKRVKNAESELLELRSSNAELLQRMAGLVQIIEHDRKLPKKSQPENGEPRQAEGNEVEVEGDYSDEDDIEGDDIEGDDIEGDDIEGDDIEGDDIEGDDIEGDDLDEYLENEDDRNSHAALEHALRRAQMAEVENGKLLAKVSRLERENKDLQNKISEPRIASNSLMTDITSSTHASLTAGDASNYHTGSPAHLQYGRGGTLRPPSPSDSGAQSVGVTEGPMDQKISGKGGQAKTIKDQENKANKRQHNNYDKDENEEEPPSKRHRSNAPARGRDVERQESGQKLGTNTCGSEKLTKKKYQNRSDDSDDESFNPSSHGHRSSDSRSVGRVSHASKAIQIVPNTGRRTNNSQACFLDAGGFNSLIPSSRNAPGGFGSGSTPRNTMSASIDELDATASNTLHVAISSAATPVDNLTTPTAANPAPTATPATASAAATSRKAKGWTNTELQALIALVRAHHNAPIGQDGARPEILHDVRLFELMSRQLQAQGINRSAGACKNEWNRRGRQVSGIDDRKIANPNQMATSLQ